MDAGTCAICRNPLGEFLLEGILGLFPRVRCVSCGLVNVINGEPAQGASEEAIALAAELDVDENTYHQVPEGMQAPPELPTEAPYTTLDETQHEAFTFENNVQEVEAEQLLADSAPFQEVQEEQVLSEPAPEELFLSDQTESADNLIVEEEPQWPEAESFGEAVFQEAQNVPPLPDDVQEVEAEQLLADSAPFQEVQEEQVLSEPAPEELFLSDQTESDDDLAALAADLDDDAFVSDPIEVSPPPLEEPSSLHMPEKTDFIPLPPEETFEENEFPPEQPTLISEDVSFAEFTKDFDKTPVPQAPKTQELAQDFDKTPVPQPPKTQEDVAPNPDSLEQPEDTRIIQNPLEEEDEKPNP